MNTTAQQRPLFPPCIILAAVLLWLFSNLLLSAAPPTQRVGLPLLLEDYPISGPLLEPIPRTNREVPLILRLIQNEPTEDGHLYTIEVQGLDPGDYNLAEFLRPVTQTTAKELPSIPIRIETALPPGLPKPTALTPTPAPRVGGYRALIWLFALAWLAGLAWLIFSGHKKKNAQSSTAEETSLAARLTPLLQSASQGKLDSEKQAQLERLMVAHWRDKLPETSTLSPAKTLAFLKEHKEASPLFLALEKWLHAPKGELSPQELEALLEPYQS